MALAGSTAAPNGSTVSLDLQTAKTWAILPARYRLLYRLATNYTKSRKAPVLLSVVASILPLLDWSGSAATLPSPAYQPRQQVVQPKRYYRWRRRYYRLGEVDSIDMQIWRLRERHYSLIICCHQHQNTQGRKCPFDITWSPRALNKPTSYIY
jgi:hypothetical protein